MKTRILSLFLALIAALGILPTAASAASSEEEALGSINIYNGGYKLAYLSINGRVREQNYTYYNYVDSNGQVREIPAYCVNPNDPGVPQTVAEGESIEYLADSKASDPKVTGIIASGYPNKSLSELGLENKYQAYYATKMALWCYLLGHWDINNLKVNPNLTGVELQRAQNILAAANKIYRMGTAWTENLEPNVTCVPDRDVAYEVTVNGRKYKQQIFTFWSKTWVCDHNPTNGLPAGTLLEGAVFEVYDKAGNVVDTIRSNSRGLAASKPLPLGRYTIREVKAPDNYGVSENVLTAYLEHSGQIVTFEVTNKSLSTGVSISKTGPKEVMGGQPVRYVFSGIANTSNVRLDNFYWRDTLPAAVTLEKVVTGTYNFPGVYKIVYKVNGAGDYRTLADNLSTSQNYTLAASPAALGLAANERVSEIMFVFGQAPAGFAQVEAPTLYCTAVPGLAAGSSFVNVADVGGVYNGQWVQAVTRWVTTVYGKPTPLPRTGY